MTGLAAITVRQPWAALIAAGIKRVENRGRSHTIRGEAAIHAALRIDPDADPVFTDAPLHFGAIVAVVDIVDCHPVTTFPNGDWCCRQVGGLLTYNARTAWHFPVDNIRPLPVPVPCRGQLRLGWPVPPDAEAAVRSQLAVEVSR